MKKVLRNIVCGLAAVNLVALAVSCSDGLDDDDVFVKNGVVNNPNKGEPTPEPETGDEFETVEVTSIKGKETSWSDDDFLKVGTDYTSQLTVGSKIYFDVAKNGEYLKFHVDNGSWGACGVSEYFNSDGTKVAGAEEDAKNAGVYNIDVSDGVYYIEVTADNIDQLKAGFAIHGNLVINKVTLKIKKTSTSNSAVEPNNGTGTENQQTTGGNGENGQTTATVTPYSTTNLTVTTGNNAYSTSTHGIQAKVTVRVGDALKGLSKDDTFVVKMKGTASKAFAPQVYFMDNTDAGGYANLGAWGDTVNFTTEEFDISKEVTISGKAPTSDDADAFVFVIDYDESSATADLENVTFNFSEFSVTKK